MDHAVVGLQCGLGSSRPTVLVEIFDFTILISLSVVI